MWVKHTRFNVTVEPFEQNIVYNFSCSCNETATTLIGTREIILSLDW